MYEVRVLTPFKDKANGNKLRKSGEVYWIEDDSRLLTLLGNNKKDLAFVEVLQAKKKLSAEYKGPKIMIYQGYLYMIGGIETFLYNLTKQYKDRNITIVCNSIDQQQLVVLSKYADILITPKQTLKCDVMILGNYDGHKYMSNVQAKKVYQMIHADLEGMAEAFGNAKMFEWKKSSLVDEVICVSDAAQKGLEKMSGYKAKTIYNILDNNYAEEEGLTFVTLSRATKEKGIYRIIEMVQEFKKANKHFIWFLCCSINQIKDRKILDTIKSLPELVLIEPTVYNKMLIKGCDYLVQLSDTESFCYSAFEALQRGVPVILTDFPEAYNIVDEGVNGYILKKDLSNLDVEKIFNHIPKADYYIDRCNLDDWEKVFKGEF